MGFLDRIKTGAKLTVRSLEVIRDNRELMMYPVLMLAVCAVVAPFLLAVFVGGLFAAETQFASDSENAEIALAIAAFITYLVFTFISTFFATALVHASYSVFRGESPDLRQSLKAATKSLGPILIWSVIAATIGLILQRMEERNRGISSLLSIAWTALTFFVVPVIALEETSIKGMFTRSAGIFRERWGVTAVGIVGTGIIQFVIVLIGGALTAGAWFLLESAPVAVVLGVITALVAFLVGTAVTGVVKTALYLYARGETLPPALADIDPNRLVKYRGGGSI